MKLLLKATLAPAALAIAAPAMAQDNPMVGGAPMLPSRTIVENAANSDVHTTLVAAVKAAGLVETLSGDGPFTVFAPTNAAFDKLPDGTVETLMKDANKEQLAKILACHVVPADAMSGAISGMIADDGGAHEVQTVGGCTLTATQDGGTIELEDERGRTATVTTADVDQSNGVIHVVDTVLLPAQQEAAMEADDGGAMEGEMAEDAAMSDEGGMADDSAMSEDSAMAEDEAMSDEDAMAAESDNPMVGGAPMFADRTIVENAVNSEAHTTLVAAVKAAGLVETLSGDGPFTVFAPTNAAFGKLPDGTVETLMKPANRDMLTKVLTAHVVAGDLSAADLKRRAQANADGFYDFNAVSGDALSAQVKGDNLYIYDESGNAALVTTSDVTQSNGVIHVTDGVLVPE